MRALVLASAFACFVPAAFAGNAVKIDSIEAKLFYTHSATLSENVAEGSGVSLWNTIIGEGGVQEPAEDVLIVVTFSGEPGTFVETQLSIDVSEKEGGNKVASRNVQSLLIPMTGKVSTAVFVPDTTCKPLDVTVTLDKVSKTAVVPFACGE